LNGYARKANALDWRSLRYMFCRQRELKEHRRDLAKKFGVRAKATGATESVVRRGNTHPGAEARFRGKLLPAWNLQA